MKASFLSLAAQIKRLNKSIAHLCHLVNVAINLGCVNNYRKYLKKIAKLEERIAPLEAMLEAEKKVALSSVKSIAPVAPIETWNDLFNVSSNPATETEISERRTLPPLRAASSKKKKTAPPPDSGHIQLSLF